MKGKNKQILIQKDSSIQNPPKKNNINENDSQNKIIPNKYNIKFNDNSLLNNIKTPEKDIINQINFNNKHNTHLRNKKTNSNKTTTINNI